MLPLLEESQSRLSTIGLDRSKFLTKTSTGQQEAAGIAQGILETEMASQQQSQVLLERKREAESDRIYKEQQLQLQKKQLEQQKEQAKDSMFFGLGSLSLIAFISSMINITYYLLLGA